MMFDQAKTILAATVLAATVALASWWHISRVHAAEKAVHAHYAQVLAEISAKTYAAQAAFRATETAWRTRIDKEAKDGQDRIETARRDADGARAAADSLRAQLARYRAAARTSQDSGASAPGPSTSDALDLLADLFAGADTAAGELAQAADMAHTAGLTCERAYDALTNRGE